MSNSDTTYLRLVRVVRRGAGYCPSAATYASSRAGKHAVEILQGFYGVLQVDGYTGYNRVKDQRGSTPITALVPVAKVHAWTSIVSRAAVFDSAV